MCSRARRKLPALCVACAFPWQKWPNGRCVWECVSRLWYAVSLDTQFEGSWCARNNSSEWIPDVHTHHNVIYNRSVEMNGTCNKRRWAHTHTHTHTHNGCIFTPKAFDTETRSPSRHKCSPTFLHYDFSHMVPTNILLGANSLELTRTLSLSHTHIHTHTHTHTHTHARSQSALLCYINYKPHFPTKRSHRLKIGWDESLNLCLIHTHTHTRALVRTHTHICCANDPTTTHTHTHTHLCQCSRWYPGARWEMIALLMEEVQLYVCVCVCVCVSPVVHCL